MIERRIILIATNNATLFTSTRSQKNGHRVTNVDTKVDYRILTPQYNRFKRALMRLNEFDVRAELERQLSLINK
jgi:hypothetical protein